MQPLALIISSLGTKLNRPAPLWLVALVMSFAFAASAGAATYATFYGGLFTPTAGAGGNLTIANGAVGAAGDAVFGLTSSGANNPYVGVSGVAQPGQLHFYTNGTGSVQTAQLDSAGALYLKSLAASQCVGTTAGSVLATTGFACYSPTIVNHAGTGLSLSAYHWVSDTATFAAASTVTVTLTGSAVFTNNTTFSCTYTEQGNLGDDIWIFASSGSSITFVNHAGASTATINYVCQGT